MRKPLIFEIKGASLDDGPGIRSVVFFKGCLLDCIWCHNPESKKAGPEISYDAAECVGCRTCIECCDLNALSPSNPFFIDRNACNLCYVCTDNCPSGALSKIGRPMDVNEIVEIVLKDKPFFDTSGGGVTFSGGEPTLYMEYAAILAKTLANNGINTLLETCGLFSFELFSNRLLPWIDTIYYDIKFIDPRKHLKYCGAVNDVILENFKKLSGMRARSGFKLLARTPVIPGYTDDAANISGIADFLNQCGVDQISLLPYHPLWREKNRKIGNHVPSGDDAEMSTWLSRERLDKCRAIFRSAGVEVV